MAKSESSFMEIHQEALVIDSHNDAIVSHIRRGNISISGHASPERIRHSGTVAYLRGPLDRADRQTEVQINIPKMGQGGVDAAFFAVDVTRAWKNHLAYALDAFGFFEAEVEANADEMIIARTAADIRNAKGAGKLGAILVIENSEGVERSLNILRMLYRVGVRSIGLTHNLSTWAAAGNSEEESGGGLTRFGRELVKEMNRLGMLVDVSHIAERGFWDTLEVSERPVIASHSNSKCDLWPGAKICPLTCFLRRFREHQGDARTGPTYLASSWSQRKSGCPLNHKCRLWGSRSEVR